MLKLPSIQTIQISKSKKNNSPINSNRNQNSINNKNKYRKGNNNNKRPSSCNRIASKPMKSYNSLEDKNK